MNPKHEPYHPLVDVLKCELENGQIERRDFLRRAVLLGASVTSAYALSGLATKAAAQAKETPKYGGNLRVSMRVKEITDPATFDWVEKSNIARHMVEPLIVLGHDNLVHPHLLEKWVPSADLKTWTLTLRKNVKWSDGSAFNADDVVFNFNRWLNPATGSSMQGRLVALTEEKETGQKDKDGKPKKTRVARPGAVTKIDEHTVRLQLGMPDLSIPESLSDYPALIVHRNFKGNLSKDPVGTGPFTLEKFEVGSTAVLKRRPDGSYWGAKPYLERITYVDLGDDATAEINAFISGQVDTNFLSSPSQLEVLKTQPHLQILEVTTASTGVARMNVTQKPFNDVRVRRALALSVDSQKALNVAYRGRGKVAEGHHVSPVHPAYVKIPARTRDVAQAKKLLADAGYPSGIDLRLDCVADPAWESETCLAIADQAREAGIRIKVNIMPGGTYWDVWKSTPFGFTAWNHRPLDVQVLNLAYRSSGSWNETGFANAEFDKTLDLAMASFKAEDRRKVMAKLEQILLDEAVIVQPFWRANVTVAHQRVRDIATHVTGEHHFSKVWLAT